MKSKPFLHAVRRILRDRDSHEGRRTRPRPIPGLLTVLVWASGLAGTAHADTVNLNPVGDTFLLSTAPDNNTGGSGGVAAGRDGASGIRRGLFQFDLSGIPPGSTVTSAVLQLTVINVPNTMPQSSTFDVVRVLAAWGEGIGVGTVPFGGNAGDPANAGEATWNSRLHGTATWTSPGAASDIAGSPSASTFVSGLGAYSWLGPDLINDVQFWVDNPPENHGWLLRSQSEGTSRTVRSFGSRETAPSQGLLVVGFLPASGSNTPPEVSIVNPTNGAVFGSPASVAIQASANDSDGNVTNVAFFDGAILLGEDTTGPDYAVTADLLPGDHTLTAVATDDDGDATVSAPVIISVANTIIDDPIAARVPKGDIRIELETIADGMASPLGMAVPEDGSDRLFVYDQDGRVWIVTASGRDPQPLLDVGGRLVTLGAYDERGLLGFATHPDFGSNGKLYTYTSEPLSGTSDFENGLGSTNNHQSVLAEWQISATNANEVDVSTRREILRIDQPQSNHNGGAMRFGPDGYLYVALGDGGAANDVGAGHVDGGNGQDPENIWGSVIRIDVDGTNAPNGQYGVPGDNPLVGTNGVDEIFAYGFRNPFSFSFDALGGELYLGDVGQRDVEEVNVLVPGGNFGWNIREGGFWFDGIGNIVAAPVRPVPPDLIDPIAMYDHDDGLAILGGYVYRGTSIPELDGTYVFGDWGSFSAPSGRLFYLNETNGVTEFLLGLNDRPLGLWIKGWGQDANGELYVFCSKVLGPSGATGRMLKLIPAPDPLAITGLSAAGNDTVEIHWTGGAGPHAVQQRTGLAQGLWRDALLTTATTTTVSGDALSGFVRVVDTAHQPAVPLSAYLSGDFQNPPVASAGDGLGLFSLDGNTLTFSLNYAGLSGAPTVAHIHGPAVVGTNAGVLIDLGPYAGSANSAKGTYSGVVVVTDSQKAHILSGLTYVNIHTVSNPGGEVRGQIAPVTMQIDLSGANERPNPVTTPGRGLGTATLVGNRLTFNLTYGGLTASASAAHIHGPATLDQSGDVLVDLAGTVDGSFGTAGSLSGSVVLTTTELGHVIQGQTYVNIHTGTHPGGEIRGQIVASAAGVPLTAALSGLAERPTPVTNSALGSATFLLQGTHLTFNVQYEALSGPATAAHIHGPASASDSAGVLVNLAPYNGSGFEASGTLSGSLTLSEEHLRHVLGAQTYVNIHTSANPGGELRGQIAPVLMTSHPAGSNERPTPVSTSADALGVLALVGNTLNLVVSYNDLTANATAAHIHGPTSVFGTAGVQVDLGALNGGAFGTSGYLSGSTVLTSDQRGYLVDGETYINIHTSTHTGGEIRGQILR